MRSRAGRIAVLFFVMATLATSVSAQLSSSGSSAPWSVGLECRGIHYSYYNWIYKDSKGTHDFNGTSDVYQGNAFCNNYKDGFTANSTDGEGYVLVAYGGQGTITLPPVGVIGFVNPKYIVVGVTYAPPGSSSFVTYTDSTLVGNTSTTTGSFQSDVNVTISVTDDISAWSALGGAAVKITGTSSTDVTQGSNSSSTVTMSKTSTVSYQTKGTPTCSPVNHDYDTIWLWLNPLVIYTVYPGTTNIQWNGYGYDKNDPAGTLGRDVVPIQVGYLNGHFGSDPTINAILARTWVTTYDPGMVWPAGQGPGITSADITNILAADPFTNSSYTLPTPLPSSTADGRFTQDPYPPNPIPYVPGETTTGYNTVDVNTQSESNGTSYTYKQAFGTEENFSGGTFLSTFTVDIKTTDTLTWAYTWLNTLTVTQTNTNALSVTEPSGCSPPYSGPGQFIVLQDNHYGTFMFYPEI
jgi:hypothetical protein